MPIYLDTETTGLSAAAGDSIVEIAIIGDDGEVLINSLVNPERPISWQAQNVHGISDTMVWGAPTLEQLLPTIVEIISGEEVVIYNAAFDRQFFPDRLRAAGRISCAMRRFSDSLGGQWRKLEVAARHVGHRWTGDAHRALADALACRSVWMWLEKRRYR